MSNKIITVWDQSTDEIIDLEIDEITLEAKPISPFANFKVRPQPASREFIAASKAAGTRPELIKAMEDEINDKD
jgi:hypothetical protein